MRYNESAFHTNAFMLLRDSVSFITYASTVLASISNGIITKGMTDCGVYVAFNSLGHIPTR